MKKEENVSETSRESRDTINVRLLQVPMFVIDRNRRIEEFEEKNKINDTKAV